MPLTEKQLQCRALACQVMDIMRGIAMGTAFQETPITEQGEMISNDIDQVEQLLHEMNVAAQEIEE